MNDDLYERLEVSPRASEAVIKAAHKALMREHHPDSLATAINVFDAFKTTRHGA